MTRLSRSQIVVLTLVLIAIVMGYYSRDLGKIQDARWLTTFPSAWVIPSKIRFPRPWLG